MEEKNGYSYHEEEGEEGGFFTDAIDHEILMHRDAHFGGRFDVMLDYYSEDKVGINPEFDFERIEYLAAIEKELGQNLAPVVLDEMEVERVERARHAYLAFKKLYDNPPKKTEIPRLIADLILSEEEEPTIEIEALVKEPENALPELIALIKSDNAYDPLFPGYGYAPYLATLCLTQIKDERAIIPLFEMLNRESVFGSEVVIEALAATGGKAEQFLIKVLKSQPKTHDNTDAACALSAFAPNDAIGRACLQELQNEKNWTNQIFCSYLLIGIEALKNSPLKTEIMELSQREKLPSFIKNELELLLKS